MWGLGFGGLGCGVWGFEGVGFRRFGPRRLVPSLDLELSDQDFWPFARVGWGYWGWGLYECWGLSLRVYL